MELLTNGMGLSVVVLFPLISAFIITLIPKAQEQLIKRFALVSSLITFVLSAVLIFQFDFSSADKLQRGNKISWSSEPQAHLQEHLQRWYLQYYFWVLL